MWLLTYLSLQYTELINEPLKYLVVFTQPRFCVFALVCAIIPPIRHPRTCRHFQSKFALLTIFGRIHYNSDRADGYTGVRCPPRGGGVNWRMNRSKAVFGSIPRSAIITYTVINNIFDLHSRIRSAAPSLSNRGPRIVLHHLPIICFQES